MFRTKLSSKGQVILPKAVRDAHRWPAGTEFDVEETAEGVLLRPARPISAIRLDELAGCLHGLSGPKTIAEMDAAIDAELRERHDRGRY